MKNEKIIDENGMIEGFVKETGIHIVTREDGYARGYFEATDRHANPNASIHGGMLFTLADTIGGAAAESRGRTVTTVSSSINFLKPAFEGDVLTAEAIEIGRASCRERV